MRRPKILLADDHTVILDGLRSILAADFEIVGAVTDGRALVAAFKKLRPDLVLTDITMPLLNGLDATRQIKKVDLGAKIIFLTMHPDVALAKEALSAGGSGYLLKHSPASEIVTAIRQVLEGRNYLSPLVTKDVLNSLMDKEGGHEELPSALSDREREVLQLVAEGHTHKAVAQTLGISVRTAQYHRYNIMEKLGLRTAPKLTQYAIKHGIISV